jgi:hypothetical protein
MFLTVLCSKLQVIFFLSRFRDSKLFLYSSLTSAKIVLTLLPNFIGLRLVIIKLVSSAYSTYLAFLAVTVGSSFIYNKKSRGLRNEPCGTPCLTSSQFE